MKRKLPNNLSLEDLTKILETTPEQKDVILEKDDVLLFMTTMKIFPGENQIKKKLLYKLYHDWSDEPVSQTSFTIKLSYYINHDNNHYLINENALAITKKVQNLAKPKKEKTKSKNYRIHFENFLNKFNLKKGSKIQVSAIVLYYLYDNWTYSNHKKRPLSTKQFNNMLNLYLGPHKRIGSTKARYYGLTEDCNDVFNDEFMKKAQEWTRSRNNE